MSIKTVDNVSVISYVKIVVKAYKNEQGNIPYRKWLSSIKDNVVKVRILQRFDRVEYGHLGSFKALANGIYELKLDFGPGYRVYYGMEEKKLIILLCGGDKSTQKKDIAKAIEYWKDYKENKNERTTNI